MRQPSRPKQHIEFLRYILLGERNLISITILVFRVPKPNFANSHLHIDDDGGRCRHAYVHVKPYIDL